MSPIFEVIPEAKTVKRTAQVVNEPLQVIPEEEELNLEVKHVSKSEHPSPGRSHATLSAMRRSPATVTLLVHRTSESSNPCVYQFRLLYPFPKNHHCEITFNPTFCYSCLARNSAKSRKSPDPLVQKRRRMYPHGGFHAILESPMERFPTLSPCPKEECAYAA
jgi:hypothetical protein